MIITKEKQVNQLLDNAYISLERALELLMDEDRYLLSAEIQDVMALLAEVEV